MNNSLIDIGAADTDAAELLGDLTTPATTFIRVELEVQLPPGQTDVNQSNLTSELERSSGIFSVDLAAALGVNVSVHVEDPPHVAATPATRAPTPPPTPKPTVPPSAEPTPGPTVHLRRELRYQPVPTAVFSTYEGRLVVGIGFSR